MPDRDRYNEKQVETAEKRPLKKPAQRLTSVLSLRSARVNFPHKNHRAIQFSGKQLNYLMILASLNTKIRVLRVLRAFRDLRRTRPNATCIQTI